MIVIDNIVIDLLVEAGMEMRFVEIADFLFL